MSSASWFLGSHTCGLHWPNTHAHTRTHAHKRYQRRPTVKLSTHTHIHTHLPSTSQVDVFPPPGAPTPSSAAPATLPPTPRPRENIVARPHWRRGRTLLRSDLVGGVFVSGRRGDSSPSPSLLTTKCSMLFICASTEVHQSVIALAWRGVQKHRCRLKRHEKRQRHRQTLSR
jgi:hypothetical protein